MAILYKHESPLGPITYQEMQKQVNICYIQNNENQIFPFPPYLFLGIFSAINMVLRKINCHC